jgi:hypothetical protein
VLSSNDAFRFFVSPYHPDSLRVPSAGPVIEAGDRLRHALTWNVFRTLEQIAPSFWMRPLVARMGGLVDDYASAPHVCEISCWAQLGPAPWAMLRRGRRDTVRADVIIATDDTVVSVFVPSLAEMTGTVLSDTAEGGLLDLIEATAVHAGVRAAYVCVVLPLGADSDTWLTRVNRRGQGVHRVLLASTRRVNNARGIGALRWHSLLSILDDAAGSDLLPSSERRLAAGTVDWVRDRLAQRDSGVRLA